MIKATYKNTSIIPSVLFAALTAVGYLQMESSVPQSIYVLFCAALSSILANHYLKARKNDQELAELYRLAYHDELTGLYNRRMLMNKLSDSVNTQAAGSLFLLDLNNFKPVNDIHGHEAGDQVLQLAAKRIQKCVGSNALVARLGGDEFVVLTHQQNHDAEKLATRIKATLASPFSVKGINESLYTGASVGVISINQPEATVSGLLKQADESMYLDKSRSKYSLSVQSLRVQDNSAVSRRQTDAAVYCRAAAA